MNSEEMKMLAEKAKPVNKRIVILRDIGDDMIGGLKIPEKSRRKFTSGIVVSKADDCDLIVSVGGRIGYQPYAGVEMTVSGDDGKDYSIIVLRQEDVTMILADDARVQQGRTEK